MPADDVRYVGHIVAQRTAFSQADAEKRVNETFTRMQTKWKEAETATLETADIARKASANAALWIFVSLLIGAFAASLAATFGGRQRDFQHSSTLSKTHHAFNASAVFGYSDSNHHLDCAVVVKMPGKIYWKSNPKPARQHPRARL